MSRALSGMNSSQLSPRVNTNARIIMNSSAVGGGIMPSKNYVRNMQMLNEIKSKLPIN